MEEKLFGEDLGRKEPGYCLDTQRYGRAGHCPYPMQCSAKFSGQLPYFTKLLS